MQTSFKLRTKITLWIESLVVILVVSTGTFTTLREKHTLENELQKRGLALSSDLAQFVTSPLLSQDIATLRRYINNSMSQEYVRHVFILDISGKVLMHNDLAEIGKVLTDSVNRLAVNSDISGCIFVSNRDEAYFDIYTPIFVSNVRLGTIRLGYSRAAIQKEIAEAQRQIFLIGVMITAMGGIVAYFMALFITSPIQKITDATRKVADGNLSIKLSINRTDEIGALAASFNDMTEDLRKTTISKDYVDNIIGSMNDTLIVISPDARIKSVNRAACELLGYREEELIGSPFSLIASDETITPWFSSQGNKTAVSNLELFYLTKNRRRIPVLFSAAALWNKDGDVIGAVGIAKDISDRLAAEAALQQSEKRLRFLSYQLLTAQEEERRRLSIELHDELGQSLMVLILRIRALQREFGTDQDALVRACEDAIGYINDITENVRRLSRNLSPSQLADLGLSAAVRNLVESSAKHSDLRISLDMQDMPGLFSQKAQIAIYRILQECLTNISKHARATHVAIDIEKQDGHALFRVEDNGKGFRTEPWEKKLVKNGMGLTTMSERARMLEGCIDIWSKEGVGTSVTLTVPFDHEGDRS